jgi:hypothetical protein
MFHRKKYLATAIVAAGLAAALSAGIAVGQDAASQALREREQQSDAFDLQLQQSLQRFRAGDLGPSERLELDALQRGQRQQQDDLFYRQQLEANSPASDAERRAETMRDEQEREQQLSGFRSGPALPEALGGAGGSASGAPI